MRLVLLWLVVEAAIGCRPRPTHSEEKVIGGRPAVAGELPAVVIYHADGGTCTGTMVARDIMVTAHHCIRGDRSEDIVSPSLVTLDLKENQLPVGSKSLIQAGKIFVIDSFFSNGKYFKRTDHRDIMDLAIIRWTTSIPVQPMPFANWLPQVKDPVMVAGFGFRSSGENPADSRLVEKHVGYNVIYAISKEPGVEHTLIKVDGLIDKQDEKKGNQPQHDASIARGDSGGPLFAIKDGMPFLVGATSGYSSGASRRRRSTFTHLLSEPSLKLLESVPELRDMAQTLRQTVASQPSTKQESTTN